MADGVGAAVLEAIDALGDAAGALRHTLAGGEEHAHAGDGAGRGVEVGDELTPGCIFAQQAALGHRGDVHYDVYHIVFIILTLELS